MFEVGLKKKKWIFDMKNKNPWYQIVILDI